MEEVSYLFWFQDEENKKMIDYIDSLNYLELKKFHTICEEHKEEARKELIDGNVNYRKIYFLRAFELAYIVDSLNFFKKHIDNEQYNLLNDFANILYYHNREEKRGRNPEVNTDNCFDSIFWSKLLDENNIPWNIQNQVSFFTHTYSNKGKYLSVLLNNVGIEIASLESKKKYLVETIK